MNIFRRLFKIGQSEAHSALDKLEDPIKLTEQGIRDLKGDLEKALHALAEVKAMGIKARNDYETERSRAKDYEKKAMLILQKGQNSEIEAGEADRLATEALNLKVQAEEQAARAKSEKEKFEANVSQLEGKVKTLRSQINSWENELKTLKARAKVSSVTKNLNKQLSNIDTDSTVTMLEKMKQKVAEDEALAESYGDIANESKSVDDEIDSALGGATPDSSEALAELKKKMGM